MATITLKTPEGETETFECDEDTYILDALEEAGIDHPYSVEQVHVHMAKNCRRIC